MKPAATKAESMPIHVQYALPPLNARSIMVPHKYM